jgi:glycosyltransferase involved in cell wall biosynthesis
MIGSWSEKVSGYIALNKFCYDKFLEIGLPANKLYIKPNFSTPIKFKDRISRSKEFLFVGRLSIEKGANVLSKFTKQASLYDLKINIAGNGPLESLFNNNSNVKMLGWLSQEEVARNMKKAYMLIMPSIYYENFPCAIVEAFSYGLPIIASNRGSIASLIEDGRTGLLFKPGDPEDLMLKVQWAIRNPKKITEMRNNVKRVFNEKYKSDINYKILLKIYKQVINQNKKNG